VIRAPFRCADVGGGSGAAALDTSEGVTLPSATFA
jgi:hypothetical protein